MTRRQALLLGCLASLMALLTACGGDSETSGEPGTYETLLGWVSQEAIEQPAWGPLAPLAMGDIGAWREATGIAAPDSQGGEEADVLAALEWMSEHGRSPWATAGVESYFLGTFEDDPHQPGLQFDFSRQVSEMLGFGRRDVEAFALELTRSVPWGVMAGDFDPVEVGARLEQCADCVPITTEVIAGTTVYAWGSGEPDPARVGERPFFDREGWGVALAVFEDHVIRTVDIESMRRALTGPTLADLEAWRATAERLDEMGSWYAQFLSAGGNCCAPGPFQYLIRPGSDLPLLDPWEVLGVGGGQDGDDRPYTTFLLAFEDAETAAANVERMETRIASIRDDTRLTGDL